ncbi:MAG: hypothetical protein J6B73_10865 [Methanobrevibacter sp.]|uniref:hypothetical protein n=1 Tax=Methanobrevibacter sp. TaxID=66852 RepID=UPI001B161673|nr:hypothetical protein [Methanobrevibacter sp.]MBO5152642.1 hypothetical protein [Methanobrevibacter sp.]
MQHQNIDKFFKVSAILFGQVFVDFFGLNYNVIRLYRNELNTFKGSDLFTDLVFETREGILLNFEFQDKKLKKEHLKKYMDYKVHLQCQSGKPVVTVIICTYHIKSDVYIYDETETSLLKPIIHYLTENYDEVKYLTIKNKINNELKLSLREIQFLVLLPFMTSKKFRLNKIRDVCNLIEKIKDKKLFDDEKYYLPLISAIHQYVSDETEQKNLIKVLTMNMPADEIYEKVMNSGIYEQGLEQGLE